MRIWYDAGTGKQVRYGAAIAKRARREGHEIFLTMRKHPDTLPIVKFLDESYLTIGAYRPRSLEARLKSGIARQLLFCKSFKKDVPDVAISHGSVDLCRVAFGLGKPIILTLDTPYADAVHRLTLPLSKYVVMSKAISRETIQKYNVDAEIITFEGVDEVAWIRNSPRIEYEYGRPLIVVRQLEKKAVYVRNSTVDMALLAKKLTKLGTVIFLSRYQRKPIKGMIVPKGFVDSLSLVGQADLFVGVGGTIAREAALQGTPAITVNTFQGQFVNDFLAERGFPMFKAEPAETFKVAEKLIGNKTNVTSLLNELANPVDVIADLVKKIEEKK